MARWSDTHGLDTGRMYRELEKMRDEERMREDLTDMEKVVEQHSKSIDNHTDKIRELLTQIVELIKLADKHETVLFAETDKNDFGIQGLYNIITDDIKAKKLLTQVVRAVITFVCAAFSAIGAFIAWFMAHYNIEIVIK